MNMFYKMLEAKFWFLDFSFFLESQIAKISAIWDSKKKPYRLQI